MINITDTFVILDDQILQILTSALQKHIIVTCMQLAQMTLVVLSAHAMRDTLVMASNAQVRIMLDHYVFFWGYK